MIKLIDPQRQKELEDIIVNLQVQVTQLSSEVQRLQEANRRNQRDIQKVYREVQESFRPQTRHMDASSWGTLTKDYREHEFMSTPTMPTRIQDEREIYQRIRDTMSGPVRLDGTPVQVVRASTAIPVQVSPTIRGTSGHTIVVDDTWDF